MEELSFDYRVSVATLSPLCSTIQPPSICLKPLKLETASYIARTQWPVITSPYLFISIPVKMTYQIPDPRLRRDITCLGNTLHYGMLTAEGKESYRQGCQEDSLSFCPRQKKTCMRPHTCLTLTHSHDCTKGQKQNHSFRLFADPALNHQPLPKGKYLLVSKGSN